jgi:NAD(P)H-hydrate repair Nnr-like enzyme with NAD(P)H-hydrate dehydratase domain
VIDEANPLALIESARGLSKRLGASIVVKGPATVCALADGSTLISATGHPGMATAGTGDVLAGIIGRLLSVIPSAEAAPLGVYLHGRAGESARRDRGTSGMTASDLFLYLPLAIKEIEDALAIDDEEDDEET